MKQTSEDRRFAARFAEELRPHVTRDQDDGKSLAQIAQKLGVTAAGLRKQLAGGTPSIRTIALAYAVYGVAVSYRDIDVTKAMTLKRKHRGGQVSERQLFLPFEITVPPSSRRFSFKRIPRRLHRYRLQITVGMST